MSQLQDKLVTRNIITDDEMWAKVAARGAPSSAVDLVLGLYTAARNGEFATVDPTLEKLLGRRATSMCELLAQKPGK